MSKPMNDRAAVHGVPGEDAGLPRMIEIPHYESLPPLTVRLRMRRMQGFKVDDYDIECVYSHSDSEGLPHYRAIGRN